MANIEPRTLKGFRDFLPKEMRKRNYVLNILKEVFESYGFEPLETPALEYDEILTGKYGDEGDKLMYRFTDNGERKVALRYDQTVPLARVVAQYQNDLPLPFKRYQIQNVYRADNTQKGRFREFLQVDIDTVGSSSLLSDAEIIALTAECYKKIGFNNNFKILINDRRIFMELVRKGLIDDSSLMLILRAVDKLEKIGEEGVLSELGKIGVDKNKRNEILDTIKFSSPNESITKLFDNLALMGVDKSVYEFSPALARGLDYYTGSIFEVVDSDYSTGSLGGGGRYDNLIGSFTNQTIPAVGFAFGFDRIIEAMEELNLFPAELNGADLLVTNTSKNSSEIAQKLREKNLKVDFYADDKDLDKQLKYADKKGVPFVLIVGEKLELKNMNTGERKEVILENLPDEINHI